jgi:predicted phage terminase large subunit-like protein
MQPEPHWILKHSASSFLKTIDGFGPRERDALLKLRFAHDPEFFAYAALPGHCRLPFAEMHRLLFRWQAGMGVTPLATRTGQRFALAAPRGSAKSTIVSLMLLLHDLVFARERYIVLLSATERQARQRLRAIRTELESPALRPWLPPDADITATGTTLRLGHIQVEAAGAGCELRGLNIDGWRPTKIVLDDAEPSRCADSPAARTRIHDWFAEVVEYLGDRYTHLMAIGTILHEKSLLATLLARPDFVTVRARSIITHAGGAGDLWQDWRRRLLDLSNTHRRRDARDWFLTNREPMESGAEVLWPEKEDYEELMCQLTLQGRRAFAQEKQNEPLGPEEALFTPERILRARWVDGTLEVLQGTDGVVVRTLNSARLAPRRVGFLDAALGKGRAKGTGDFAALAVVLAFPDGTLLVERLEARRIPPSEQVRRLFDQHAAAPFHDLAIEGTGFQELLLLPIAEEQRIRRRDGNAVELPVRAVHPNRSKAARIASLEPLFCSGRLVLGEGLDEELWEELRTWPRSTHDDALDAIAGAVELAELTRKSKNIFDSIRPPTSSLRTY